MTYCNMNLKIFNAILIFCFIFGNTKTKNVVILTFLAFLILKIK